MKRLTLLLALFLTSCSAAHREDSWLVDQPSPTCSIQKASQSGLAVVFNTRLRHSDLAGDPYMGWPQQNRKLIMEKLRENSSQIIEIPDLALQKVAINPVDEREVVESYNNAAVEAGAKYLLILHAAGGVKESPNWTRLLYLTLIGAFIFPGEEGNGQASLQAFLYQAGSRSPCYVLETEGYSYQMRPIVFYDIRSLYALARDRAFEKFIENLF